MSSTANTTTPASGGDVMPIYVVSVASGSEQNIHQATLSFQHNGGNPSLST